MRPSESVTEPWSRLAVTEPDWDWEAACIDGKLFRFGYCRDQVLVLVLTLDAATLIRGRPSH